MPNTKYTSITELNNNYAAFTYNPIYIKTHDSHELCIYFNEREFCFSPNFWDTNAVTTTPKLENALRQALNINDSLIWCDYDNNGATASYCYIDNSSSETNYFKYVLYAANNGSVSIWSHGGVGGCFIESSGVANCNSG